MQPARAAAPATAAAAARARPQSMPCSRLIFLERAEQSLQVRRQRRFPGHFTPRHRMLQFQTRGMQRLARKARQLRGQLRRAAGGNAAPPAVNRVAHERKSSVREVYPDLVGAAGFKFDPHQGVRAEALRDTLRTTVSA